MSIKHFGFLSWVHERNGRPKYKNHAQDCETLIRDQHPAILPWFLYFGWRPSFRVVRAPCPLCPAAGLLLDVVFEHDLLETCSDLRMIVFRKSKVRFFGKSCENARKQRA
jgi:hypothetical protein